MISLHRAYAQFVYNIVAEKSKKLDAVYEDYILHLVGIEGMRALIEYNLVEPCGSVEGRKLYVLRDK